MKEKSKNQLAALKRWQNKEYREKVVNSMKGRKNFLNKEHTIEIKKKISNSMKGNKNSLKKK